MNTGWLTVSAVALVALSCGGQSDSREESSSSTQEYTEENLSLSNCADRTQFGGDSTHQNSTCVVGQEITKQISTAIYDPFVHRRLPKPGVTPSWCTIRCR